MKHVVFAEPSRTADSSNISLTRVTSLLLGGRLIGVVFGLINSVVLARGLGAEALGQYAYAMGLVALFGLMPNFGTSTVITRAIALDPKSSGPVFCAARRVQFLLGVGSFALIMLLAVAIPHHPVSIMNIALAGGQLVLGALSVPYIAILAGRARYDRAALVELSNGCLGTLSFLCVALFGGGLTEFLVAQIINATSSIVLARWGAATMLPDKHGPRYSMSAILRQSIPFGAGGIVHCVYSRIDILLLGQMAMPVVLGLYSAAYKPINMLQNFGTSASGTLFPYLVRETRGETSGSFDRVLKLIMVVAPAMALVVGGLAQPLLEGLFGHEFGPAAGMLAILAWSAAANWLYSICGITLQARGQEYAWMWGLVGAFVLNVLLNLWAIPRWGGVGAAISTLLCEFSILIWSALVLRHAFGVTASFRFAPACAIAAAVALVVLIGLQGVGAVLATTSALCVYIAVLWGLGVVMMSDVMKLVRRFRETTQGHGRT